MIYGLLVFAGAFTLFFGWLAIRGLRTGAVQSRRLTARTWTDDRATAPVRYWLGIAAMLINAAAGAICCLWLVAQLGR